MIIKAFEKAFEKMHKRNWNKIYLAIDLHDTVFRGCYHMDDEFQWLGKAKEALQFLSNIPEISLIIWSSSHKSDLDQYQQKFIENDIKINYFNENPEVESNDVGDFSSKFYFNVLIDDKAGFDAEIDWQKIINFLEKNK